MCLLWSLTIIFYSNERSVVAQISPGGIDLLYFVYSCCYWNRLDGCCDAVWSNRTCAFEYGVTFTFIENYRILLQFPFHCSWFDTSAQSHNCETDYKYNRDKDQRDKSKHIDEVILEEVELPSVVVQLPQRSVLREEFHVAHEELNGNCYAQHYRN